MIEGRNRWNAVDGEVDSAEGVTMDKRMANGMGNGLE